MERLRRRLVVAFLASVTTVIFVVFGLPYESMEENIISMVAGATWVTIFMRQLEQSSVSPNKTIVENTTNMLARLTWVSPPPVILPNLAQVRVSGGIVKTVMGVNAIGAARANTTTTPTTTTTTTTTTTSKKTWARQRAAVIFYGLSYEQNYAWTQEQRLTIDYRWSLSNYRKYIFDYLYNEGFATDVFLCTRSSRLDTSLLQDYMPVRHKFIPRGAGRNTDKGLAKDHTARLIKMTTAIRLCLEYHAMWSANYSRVIITRFDLIFRESFAVSSIDWDKLNFVSMLVERSAIDDNFYAMPFRKLQQFYFVLQILQRSRHHPHYALRDFERFAKVNFIKNEFKPVGALSWFYIVRNSTSGTCVSSKWC